MAHPYSHRVVAYFDVDCFYAQAEILQRPHLQGRPVGVTQKFLVVTCNYEARQRGVPKMASIQAAKERCPDLLLFNGEDLTPYRAASKSIMAILGRFGVLERRGLDEAALDITMEVTKRSTSFERHKGFSGHVLGQDPNENMLDISASFCADRNSCDYYLMVGSQVVAEIRAAVERESGFRCSSGIATNKMLAKLVSSVNKPNKQTCILESAVSGFLMPLHVRKLPGIGLQTEAQLKDMGIATVADLQQSTLQQLSSKFGNRMGMLLFDSCRGVDKSLVQDKGPPKSLSVEDSFQPCTSFGQAEEIIRRLAPDLISRLNEDKEEYSRMPKVFTVKWRYPGSWAFKSSSMPMPTELLSACVPLEHRLEILVEIAMKLLSQSLGRQPFSIVVLNVGATSFTCSSHGSPGASHDIRSFLSNHLQSTKQTLQKVISKREARVSREESEKGRPDKPVVDYFEDNSVQDNHGHVPTLGHDDLELDEEEYNTDPDQDERESSSFDIYSMQPTFRQSLPCASMETSLSGHSLAHPAVGSLSNKELPVEASGPLSKSCGMRSAATDYLLETLSSSAAMAEKNATASNDLFQERREYRNLNSGQKKGESKAVRDQKGSICEVCGQVVEGDFQSQQEHNDYHYALNLHTREQSLSKSILNTSLSPSKMAGSKHKATKQAHPHHPSLKKKKSLNDRTGVQSSTLDCFLYRSQGR